MGGSASQPWEDPSGQGTQEQTELVELVIDGSAYASYAIGAKPKGCTPLVLRPKPEGCSCCCRPIVIPSGFTVMGEKFSQEIAEDIQPGIHFCWLFQGIKWMVTEMETPFATPSKECKTADNISVELRAVLVIKVVDARLMKRATSVQNLMQTLTATVDQSLRQLSLSTTHDKIYELQGTDMQGELAAVNEKFVKDYGIEVKSFIVTDVLLPQDVTTRMEDETMFTAKNRKEKMEQQLNLMSQEQDNALKKIQEVAEIEKQRAEQEAVTTEARIELEIAAITSNTSKEVAKIDAEKRESVQTLLNDAELEVAELTNKADEIAREVEAETSRQKNDIITDALTYVREKQTMTSLENSERFANAKRLVGESEKLGQDLVRMNRGFEEDKAKLEVFASVAHNKSVRISGTSEVNAKGLTFNDDRVSQFVQTTMRHFHGLMSESLAPAQEPLMGSKNR